ncbi:MAG: S-adenosyl-L-methionine-dependent methyltransferase [Monoraphidium minutum]|nr:MAG: S-adenosyl-L-methionine-dependent methyltransferase [Monoraphidium minutum]
MELRNRSIPPSPEGGAPRSRGGSGDGGGSLLKATMSVALEDVPDVPFKDLCHEGSKVTAKNWLNKLWRFTIVPTKEIYLPFMFSGMPTNYLMLTYRTFNRDFGLPNCNDDYLAPLLRDELMPVRGRQHRERDPELWYRNRCLDIKYLGVPGITNFIDARTQWIDDGLSRALDDGIKQVVIIAAGYDTRAYRLSRPGVKFYEVDLPHASQKKRELVEKLLPRDKYSWPELIGADLSKVSLMDALADSSFDKSKKTFYSIEGLVYYLPPLAFKGLLTAISETAVVGSRVYFDFINLSTMAGEVWHPGFETLMVSVWNKGEYFLSGVDERKEAVRSLLKKFGFALHELVYAKAMAARYLPHLPWRESPPPLPPYFSYCAAEKVMPPFKRRDSLELPQ